MPEPIRTEGQEPYVILKIDALTRLSDIGGVEKYYRIQYKTKGGVTDSANIEEKDYTEDKVDAALTKLAQKHDKILAL